MHIHHQFMQLGLHVVSRGEMPTIAMLRHASREAAEQYFYGSDITVWIPVVPDSYGYRWSQTALNPSACTFSCVCTFSCAPQMFCCLSNGAQVAPDSSDPQIPRLYGTRGQQSWLPLLSTCSS